jgi:hypothetical protein
MNTLITEILTNKEARGGSVRAPLAQSDFSPWDTV